MIIVDDDDDDDDGDDDGDDDDDNIEKCELFLECLPGNSVLATMVPVYRPLTISNTFSKRPHKPCNTSENVESGTTLGHFDIEFPILKGVNV